MLIRMVRYSLDGKVGECLPCAPNANIVLSTGLILTQVSSTTFRDLRPLLITL